MTNDHPSKLLRVMVFMLPIVLVAGLFRVMDSQLHIVDAVRSLALSHQSWEPTKAQVGYAEHDCRHDGFHVTDIYQRQAPTFDSHFQATGPQLLYRCGRLDGVEITNIVDLPEINAVPHTH